MSFSYFDNNGKLTELNLDAFQIGKEWRNIETNNEYLNSIFTSPRVDVNNDGKIDKKELNILKAILKLADGITKFHGKLSERKIWSW